MPRDRSACIGNELAPVLTVGSFHGLGGGGASPFQLGPGDLESLLELEDPPHALEVHPRRGEVAVRRRRTPRGRLLLYSRLAPSRGFDPRRGRVGIRWTPEKEDR